MAESASDPQEHSLVVGEFTQTLYDLLESLVQVFPECDATSRAFDQFRMLVYPSPEMQLQFIRQWYEKMKHYEQEIAARDLEGLARAESEIPVLRDLHLVDKFKDPDFSDDSRAHLWSYFANLNAYAKIYNQIPSRLVKRIEEAAVACGAEGENEMPNWNRMLMSILEETSPEELQSLSTNLGSLFSAVSSTDAFAALNEIPGGLGNVMSTEMIQQMFQMNTMHAMMTNNHAGNTHGH